MTSPLFPTNTSKYWASDRLYDALKGLAPGTFVDYPRLRDIIQADPQTSYGRSIVLRVRDRLLRDVQMLLVNVREQGYRLALASEHRAVSVNLQDQGRRRLRRAQLVVVHVRWDELTPTQQNALLQENVRVSLKLAIDRRLSRVTRLPAKAELTLPSGRTLVQLLTKSA